MKYTNKLTIRLDTITKRIDNVKNLSIDIFDKTYSEDLYKSFSEIWTIRINLYDGIIVKNYR